MTLETLHLCNTNHQLNIGEYSELISENDAVVFYSEELKKSQYDSLITLFNNHSVYFVIDRNFHNLKTITYDEWVSLLNLYKKTLTWK